MQKMRAKLASNHCLILTWVSEMEKLVACVPWQSTGRTLRAESSVDRWKWLPSASSRTHHNSCFTSW